ncbi:MAG: hemolysin family protein [Flavobacteriaceae bacterium]|nr:hemolysin family protein [Flavobacteriaceae bacterium]MDG1961701.1 hemolysin family protein [Flavobacteriaceae bacterium]
MGDFSLLIIFLSLLCSAFFSGMEIAYVSANKIHLEIEKKKNNFFSIILKRITKRPSKFIATMLVGNNIALVVYGLFMGDLLMNLMPLAGLWGLLVQTLVSTLVILLTAEFLPKVFFQIYANRLVTVLAFPAYLFYLLFSVVSEFVIWISDVILKHVFRTQGDAVQLTFSKVELGHYINEQMESVEQEDAVDSEIQIFQNALEFSEVKAREVMIPRTEVIGVEDDISPKELGKKFTETGLSKVLVYRENIDDIVGYVHSFELFKKPSDIKQVLMPVVFVPETMLAKDVLQILTRKRKSIAVVVDEYGGTAGIITVEDIIEELFGEIEDEHDSLALIEEEIGEGHYHFSARLEVDYLNEAFKLNLPENDQYETLGGLIVFVTEEIPEKGEVVDLEDFTVTILEVSNTKIELVALKKNPED